MRLNRAWIERHIPHHGSMCLLEEVLSWDADRIRCSSDSHRSPDNPLRARGRLGIACGIEYAAQAMAVHAALAGEALQARPAPVPARTGEPGQDGPSQASQDPGRTAPGFLAGVRSVEFHVLRLDDVAGELMCDATRVAGDRGTALYEFELSSQTVKLLGGRATVIIGAREQKQS